MSVTFTFPGKRLRNPVIMRLVGPRSLSGCFEEKKKLFFPVKNRTLSPSPPSPALITTSAQALFETPLARSVQWTRPRTGLSGFRNLTGVKTFLVQLSSQSHPASHKKSTGFFFPRVKRPGGKVDNPPPLSVDVKHEWSFTSTPPIRLHGFSRDKFTFSFTGLSHYLTISQDTVHTVHSA